MPTDLNHDRYLRLIRGETRSPIAAAARTGLRLASGPYRSAVALRNRLFDLGLRQPARLGRPTISVGNLTTGGTGKTPMVIEIARRLRDAGHRPAVLLRGYGGDETRELQAALASLPTDVSDPAPPAPPAGGQSMVPVEANPSRVAQAADLLTRQPEVGAFVLDDGFQHRQAHRDLDLVLIDATDPFGGERLLPRGLLREPMGNLRRADAVIVTRCDQLPPEALAQLDQRIAALTGRAPLAHVTARWAALRGPESRGEGEQPIEALRDRRVLGACGIGNPRAFERQLRETAGAVAAVEVRRDHYPWTADDLRALLARAAEGGAEAIVTTEKDWVKWQPLLAEATTAGATAGRAAPLDLPIYRPVLAIRFLDGEEAFATLLSQTVAASRCSTL